MSFNRFILLPVLVIVLFTAACSSSSEVISAEEHAANVAAEDVSEILFREPSFLGGPQSFFTVLRYPKSDRDRGREGTVILAYTVTEQGLPENVRVQRTSGFASLDGYAVEAMEQMRFLPGVRRGQRMAVESTFPVDFRIN